MPHRLVFAALAALAAFAVVALPLVARADEGAPPRRLTLFYTAEVHGAVEPCGCTSDPLGDVSRLARVIDEARLRGAVALVDAGDLLYPQGGIAKKKRAAADLKATFLAQTFGKLGLIGAGLGETDVAGGVDKITPARLASNLDGKGLTRAEVRTLGGIKLGVLGVADPALASAVGGAGSDPVVAAKREADRLRREGAEIVVALAPVDRPVALRLAREAAVDFVVLGRQVGKGRARADQVGRAFILVPGEELEHVGRLDLVLRGEGAAALADAGGADTLILRRKEIDEKLAALDGDLLRWAQDKNADRAFVDDKKQERARLAEEGAALPKVWSPPATGSYFTNQLVPLRRALPRSAPVAAGMKKLDVAIGKANLAAAEPPAAAEPGRATFVGMAKCVGCHKGAATFWNKTIHAHAWRTLVVGGKENDYDCASCHATAFGEVGGSNIGFTKGLQNVQCEVCHGPGSLHVAAEGLEEPVALTLTVTPSTCKRCHNEKHSDTFAFEPYLRDILGKGHGAEARAKLGPGATGHELRAVAKAKAKAAGAAMTMK